MSARDGSLRPLEVMRRRLSYAVAAGRRQSRKLCALLAAERSTLQARCRKAVRSLRTLYIGGLVKLRGTMAANGTMTGTAEERGRLYEFAATPDHPEQSR
jgi:hypothetical protein